MVFRLSVANDDRRVAVAKHASLGLVGSRGNQGQTKPGQQKQSSHCLPPFRWKPAHYTSKRSRTQIVFRITQHTYRLQAERRKL